MVKVFLRRLVVFALLGLGLSGFFSWQATPLYEAQVALQVGSPRRVVDPGLGADVGAIIDRGNPGFTPTEIQVVGGAGVFLRALTMVEQEGVPGASEVRRNWREYFRMYSVLTRVVENPDQQSSIAQIQLRLPSLALAESFAQNLQFAYDAVRSETATEAVASAVRRVDDQLQRASEAARNADLAWKQAKVEAGTADLTLTTQQNIVYEAQLRARLDSLEAELQSVDAEIGSLVASIRRVPEVSSAGDSDSRNPVMVQLEGRLVELRSQRATLLSTYFEDSVPVQAVDQTIQQVEADLATERTRPFTASMRTTQPDQIRRGLEQLLEQSRARRSGISTTIQEVRSQLNGQQELLAAVPAQEQRLAELLRDREITDQQYRRALIMMDEVRQRQSPVPASTLVGVFVDPQPVEPNLMRNLILGLLGGICLGLLYGFAMESMNPRVYGATQVQQLTGLPVAASLPPVAVMPRMLTALAKRAGAPAESFRYLAASSFAASSGPRIVLFTGIGRRADVPICALNYAVSMAQAGLRVLLIDADHNLHLSKALEKSASKGITNHFQSGDSLNDLVLATEHERLSFMPFGNVSGKRISDFPVTQLGESLAVLKGTYDLVVVGALPADVYADASRLAPFVSETYVVFSIKTTQLGMIPAVAMLLQNAGCDNIQLVLSHVSDISEPFAAANRAIASK